MRDHTRLEVYWARLARNWQRIQDLAPQARVLPMVKANAYGHGLIPVSRFLTEELGASLLGVATLGEAEAVIRELPDYRGKVYAFSEVNLRDKATHARYAGDNIHPVVSTFEDLEIFLHDRCFKHLPLVLKLNTGMNRLGLAENEWEAAGALIKQAGRTSIQHLLTHYAYSYQTLKPGDRTNRQAESFKKALALLRGQGLSIEETSLANSGAIEQKFTVDETWVRPGLMLYGPPSVNWNGEIVSSLVTRIMKVFPVKKGLPVGYGGNTTAEEGLMAVIPLGYGDGFPTQASGWTFQHQGMKAKVFGRVNMDMTFLFFPTEALGRVKVGDEVRLWDADPAPLLSYAEHMQTHAYQALCALSSRVPRIYRLE